MQSANYRPGCHTADHMLRCMWTSCYFAHDIALLSYRIQAECYMGLCTLPHEWQRRQHHPMDTLPSHLQHPFKHSHVTGRTDAQHCHFLQCPGRCTMGMQTPFQQWQLQQQQLADCPPAQLQAPCISQAPCTSLALRPICTQASAMLRWRSCEQHLRGLLWKGIGRSSMRRVTFYWPW